MLHNFTDKCLKYHYMYALPSGCYRGALLVSVMNACCTILRNLFTCYYVFEVWLKCYPVLPCEVICLLHCIVKGFAYIIVLLIAYILCCTNYFNCTTVYTAIIGDVTMTSPPGGDAVWSWNCKVLPSLVIQDLTRFNKICHPSQRPRWQVDKEAIGLSRVQQYEMTMDMEISW